MTQPRGDPGSQESLVSPGTSIPHTFHVTGLPLPLWEFHTPESWARAVLQEALDFASRPLQPHPGHPEDPVRVPRANVIFPVQFTVLRLPDGTVGVAATFERVAQGNEIFFNHHLLQLPVRASEPPPDTAPPGEVTAGAGG